MKKRIISLFMVLVFVFLCVPQVYADDEVLADVVYRIDGAAADALTDGHLTAYLQIANVSDSRRFIAALIYCKKSGEVIDFETKVIETSSVITDEVLELYIHGHLGIGSFVKTVLMDAQTLSPIDVDGARIFYTPFVTGVDTEYDDSYERYYTIEGADGSLVALGYDGYAVICGDEGTAFRLKDMSDGYVSFADSGDLELRLSNYWGTVWTTAYSPGYTSSLWHLTRLSNGRYYISHYDGGYMAIKNGEVKVSDTPYEFALRFVGESPFTLITSLDGYKLLTKAEKQRIVEVCTSVGAGAFPSGYNSLSKRLDNAFMEIYNSRDGITPAEQKRRILAALAITPTYNSVTTSEIPSVYIRDLPGGGASIARSPVTRESAYIWDIGENVYNRVDVTYVGSGRAQRVKFYYDERGALNVDYAIEALARFPYEYRQFITEVDVYIPQMGPYSYNCSGPTLIVRVPVGTSLESMVRNFAHELGHSLDFCANRDYGGGYWSQSYEWQKAVANDITTVSDYAKTNDAEGLAEFARLYFQSYGNRDRMVGLRQLYPNRYYSFVRLLNAVGMETMY